MVVVTLGERRRARITLDGSDDPIMRHVELRGKAAGSDGAHTTLHKPATRLHYCVCGVGLLEKQTAVNSAGAVNRVPGSVDYGQVCSNTLFTHVPAAQLPRELNVRENNIDAMRLDECEGAFRRAGFKNLQTG